MNEPISKEAVEAAKTITDCVRYALRHFRSTQTDWLTITESIGTVIQSAITKACAERPATWQQLDKETRDYYENIEAECGRSRLQLAKMKEALVDYLQHPSSDGKQPERTAKRRRLIDLVNLPAAAKTETEKEQALEEKEADVSAGDPSKQEEREGVLTHSLKTWPMFFEAVLNGSKTFEVRKDDRGFKVGDTLELHEYDPEAGMFSDRGPLKRKVAYIMRGPAFGVAAGHVVMGLAPSDPSGLKSADASSSPKSASVELSNAGNVETGNALRECKDQMCFLRSVILSGEHMNADDVRKFAEVLSRANAALLLSEHATESDSGSGSPKSVGGIVIPKGPPPGIVFALREFVNTVLDYDKTGVWPDNGTIRKLAEQGQEALGGQSASVSPAAAEELLKASDDIRKNYEAICLNGGIGRCIAISVKQFDALCSAIDTSRKAD